MMRHVASNMRQACASSGESTPPEAAARADPPPGAPGKRPPPESPPESSLAGSFADRSASFAASAATASTSGTSAHRFSPHGDADNAGRSRTVHAPSPPSAFFPFPSGEVPGFEKRVERVGEDAARRGGAVEPTPIGGGGDDGDGGLHGGRAAVRAQHGVRVERAEHPKRQFALRGARVAGIVVARPPRIRARGRPRTPGTSHSCHPACSRSACALAGAPSTSLSKSSSTPRASARPDTFRAGEGEAPRRRRGRFRGRPWTTRRRRDAGAPRQTRSRRRRRRRASASHGTSPRRRRPRRRRRLPWRRRRRQPWTRRDTPPRRGF